MYWINLNSFEATTLSYKSFYILIVYIPVGIMLSSDFQTENPFLFEQVIGHVPLYSCPSCYRCNGTGNGQGGDL